MSHFCNVFFRMCVCLNLFLDLSRRSWAIATTQTATDGIAIFQVSQTKHKTFTFMENLSFYQYLKCLPTFVRMQINLCWYFKVSAIKLSRTQRIGREGGKSVRNFVSLYYIHSPFISVRLHFSLIFPSTVHIIICPSIWYCSFNPYTWVLLFSIYHSFHSLFTLFSLLSSFASVCRFQDTFFLLFSEPFAIFYSSYSSNTRTHWNGYFVHINVSHS